MSISTSDWPAIDMYTSRYMCTYNMISDAMYMHVDAQRICQPIHVQATCTCMFLSMHMYFNILQVQVYAVCGYKCIRPYTGKTFTIAFLMETTKGSSLLRSVNLHTPWLQSNVQETGA